MRLPEIRRGFGALLPAVDFLGLNTYYVNYMKAEEDAWPIGGIAVKTGRPKTDADWERTPEGMYALLKWIQENYAPGKIIITENGAACNDWVSVDGAVRDPNRIDYLRRYLAEVHRAIQEGVPVKGGIMSGASVIILSGLGGLSRRFGMIYVDYPTQKRIP